MFFFNSFCLQKQIGHDAYPVEQHSPEFCYPGFSKFIVSTYQLNDETGTKSGETKLSVRNGRTAEQR